MRARIERPADKPAIVRRDAHQRRHAARARRHQAAQHLGMAAYTVLLIDRDEVAARFRRQFHREWASRAPARH